MTTRGESVPQHVRAHPGASSLEVSARMSRLSRRDNPAELALRHALHSRGLRYRINYPVPGAPRRSIDIAFTRRKIAVFLDGCYWHGCPAHRTQPKSNPEWWIEKFRANEQRDKDTDRLLQERGWVVLRIWEHECFESSVNRVLDVHGRATAIVRLR